MIYVITFFNIEILLTAEIQRMQNSFYYIFRPQNSHDAIIKGLSFAYHFIQFEIVQLQYST